MKFSINPTHIAIIALFFLLPLLLSNNAQAAPLVCDSGGPLKETCPVGLGDVGDQVSLRDITDTTNDTKSVSVSLDKSSYHVGDAATLRITDYYANLTSSTTEKISAKVTSSSDSNGISLILTETGPNTSNFVGSFTFTSGPSSGNALHFKPGDTVHVKYDKSPTYAPRFQATFDNAGTAGDVILGDQNLTSDDEINTPMSTIIESANFTLANGDSLDPGTGKITVTFSYANAQFGCTIGVGGCDPSLLDVFVEPPTSSTFRGIVQDFGEPVTVDTIAKTVTADVNVGTSGGGQTSGSWLIVLAFAGGSPGGGGGGVIVNPSLVIDAAAALTSAPGGSGSESVAPSLLYSPALSGGMSKYLPKNPTDVIMPSTDTSVIFPLDIDGKGFALNGYSNKILTNTLEVGKPFDMKLNFQKNNYPIQHVSIYIHLPHDTDEITDSDTYVAYDKDSPLEIHDPHEFFSKVSVSDNSTDLYTSFNYDINFAKPMNTSDVIVRVWDIVRHSQDIKILNAWQVLPSPTNPIVYAKKALVNETSPAMTPVLNNGTNSQLIGNELNTIEMIKEWSGYSPESISDEQLLKSLGLSGSHIPSWVMKTTHWLISGDIDQKEFIESIKYLHDGGVIK